MHKKAYTYVEIRKKKETRLIAANLLIIKNYPSSFNK